MAGNQVPNNIEDPTILKRFLTDLVSGLNTNPYYSGNVSALQEAIVSALSNSTSNVDFLNNLSTLTELRTDILKYIEDNLETVILQNQEDVALIAEQYGAFYDQALAASWYGLSVKAGGAIAGLEVGSLDPDVTTPGDESSYFRIIADNFVLGRAYEDLSVEEKAYLSTNGLPAFGTVYNADKTPMPAIVTSWDNINKVYKHFFNGIVQFSNISGADYASAINNGTTTINGGLINTVGLIAENISATEINGIIINGGIINGARINGAVIKASYLDLDGELEVLTNYHISVATRNANPSLYTDAVYISTDNEYRIPSMSSISYLSSVTTLSGSYNGVTSYTKSSLLYSYETANVGRNTKAVKIVPTVTFSLSGNLYNSLSSSSTNSFSMYLGSTLLFNVSHYVSGYGVYVTISGLTSSSFSNSTDNTTQSRTISFGGISLIVKATKTTSISTSYGCSVSLSSSTMTMSGINFTSGQIYFTATNSVSMLYSGNNLIEFRSPNITINNMI